MQNMNNNFNPYNYGNYGNFNYPNFNQPNYYQQPKSNQYEWVNGVEGAKAYQIQPNQTVMLLDADNPIIYKKTSNQQGQSSLQYFKMIEISEEELKNLNAPQPSVEYATKEDFEGLKKKIDNLYKKIDKKGR